MQLNDNDLVKILKCISIASDEGFHDADDLLIKLIEGNKDKLPNHWVDSLDKLKKEYEWRYEVPFS